MSVRVAAMFRNTFQSGFLSILYSIGSKPLQIWDKKVRNGHIKRITDPDIQSSVLEIMGTNVSTTFIQCPADAKKTLGIKLPFLVMIIKNVSLLSCRSAVNCAALCCASQCCAALRGCSSPAVLPVARGLAPPVAPTR